MKDEKDGSLEMKALMKKKQAVSESIVNYDIALSSKRKLRAEDVDLFMEIYKTGGEKGRKRLVNASKIDPLIVNGFYNQDGTLKPMETITGLINKTLKQQNTKKTSSKQMTSTQNSELVQKAQARLNRTGATKKINNNLNAIRHSRLKKESNSGNIQSSRIRSIARRFYNESNPGEKLEYIRTLASNIRKRKSPPLSEADAKFLISEYRKIKELNGDINVRSQQERIQNNQVISNLQRIKPTPPTSPKPKIELNHNINNASA